MSFNQLLSFKNSRQIKEVSPAEVQNVREQLAEKAYKVFVTPEEFGAVGDGINDDYTAIQAAFDSGLNVSFSNNKTYLVSQHLSINHHCSITGSGSTIKASSILSLAETNPVYGLIDIDGANSVYIDSLNVDGSKVYYTRVNIVGYVGYDDYWNNRSKGTSGIRIDNSNNIWVRNCHVHNTTVGLMCMRSENVNISNCHASYTSADGFPVYTGCKNIFISDCFAEYNGDDAFPVYSQTNIVGAFQTENVFISNCYSNHCMSRAFLNHGGKHVCFSNCKALMAKSLCGVLGNTSGNYSVYDTDDTIFKNVSGTAGLFEGYSTTVDYGMNLMSTGKVVFDGVSYEVDASIDFSGDTRDLRINQSNTGDIYFTNCSFKTYNYYMSGTANIYINGGSCLETKKHAQFFSSAVRINNWKETITGTASYSLSLSGNSMFFSINNSELPKLPIAGTMGAGAEVIIDGSAELSTATLTGVTAKIIGCPIVNNLPALIRNYVVGSQVAYSGYIYTYVNGAWAKVNYSA